MLSLALRYLKKNARKSGVGRGQFEPGVNGLIQFSTAPINSKSLFINFLRNGQGKCASGLFI